MAKRKQQTKASDGVAKLNDDDILMHLRANDCYQLINDLKGVAEDKTHPFRGQAQEILFDLAFRSTTYLESLKADPDERLIQKAAIHAAVPSLWSPTPKIQEELIKRNEKLPVGMNHLIQPGTKAEITSPASVVGMRAFRKLEEFVLTESSHYTDAQNSELESIEGMWNSKRKQNKSRNPGGGFIPHAGTFLENAKKLPNLIESGFRNVWPLVATISDALWEKWLPAGSSKPEQKRVRQSIESFLNRRVER